LLQLAGKAVELDGILANGGMDAQGRLRAHGMARGGGIGAQDQVTDTTHVEHQALGATLHHRAVQPRDHGATSRKRARWMWQMAAASASQACSSPGSFTPSKSATMRLTCSLAARPLPVTARLISEGAYSCTGSSPPVAAKAAPRACPRTRAVWAFTEEKTRSTDTACGRARSQTARTPAAISARRCARGADSRGEMVPHSTRTSELPRRSTTPPPARREPGSMPRTRRQR